MPALPDYYREDRHLFLTVFRYTRFFIVCIDEIDENRIKKNEILLKNLL